MSAHLQTLLLALTVAFAYWWLQTPTLAFYSLQVFSLTVVLYFVAKRFSKAKIWHIAPTAQSLEMILASFAFLILVGSTGNKESILFPFTYVHLFFLVFSTQISTSIITGLLLVVFHYALGPDSNLAEMSELLTIPIMLVFFLFTKHQYNEVIKEKKIIENEEIALAESLKARTSLTKLIKKFILPKLSQIKEMALHADKNRDAIMGQIIIIQMEVEKFLQENRFNDEE